MTEFERGWETAELGCQFLTSGAGQCDGAPVFGVSVRQFPSEDWVTWPACARHHVPLAIELGSFPWLVVSRGYALGDDEARAWAEAFAEYELSA